MDKYRLQLTYYRTISAVAAGSQETLPPVETYQC